MAAGRPMPWPVISAESPAFRCITPCLLLSIILLMTIIRRCFRFGSPAFCPFSVAASPTSLANLGNAPIAIVPALLRRQHHAIQETCRPRSSSFHSSFLFLSSHAFLARRSAMTLATSNAASDYPTVDGAPPLVPDAPPLPFAKLCARLDDAIASFLDQDFQDGRLVAVQAQTRVALGVIEEALQRYRWVQPATLPPSIDHFLICHNHQLLRAVPILQWRQRLPCSSCPLPRSHTPTQCRHLDSDSALAPIRLHTVRPPLSRS